MKLTPLDKRPRHARVSTKFDRQECWLQLAEIVDVFMEGGHDWAEIEGWGKYFADARSAQQGMSFELTRTYSVRQGIPVPVHCHRVGNSLYLHRRFDND